MPEFNELSKGDKPNFPSIEFDWGVVENYDQTDCAPEAAETHEIDDLTDDLSPNLSENPARRFERVFSLPGVTSIRI